MKETKLAIIWTILLTVLLFPISSFAEGDANGETYTPYKGHVLIGDDLDGRFASQDLYWSSHSLEEFDASNDTYEQEVIFYNYDGEAYATTATSYESDLPDTYLDTQAFDGDNEYNIAVGCFDPNLINGGDWYDTEIRLNTTESDESMYKISCQEGYSIGEIGPWNVFSQSTSKIIPFDNEFAAPDDRRWRYEWEYNDSRSMADENYRSRWCVGNISSSSDEDYWKFYNISTRTVDFLLKLPNSEVDYDIKIYDEDGDYVTGSFEGAGNDEEFSVTLSEGDYYMKVYSYSGYDETTNYQLIAY